MKSGNFSTRRLSLWGSKKNTPKSSCGTSLSEQALEPKSRGNGLSWASPATHGQFHQISHIFSKELEALHLPRNPPCPAEGTGTRREQHVPAMREACVRHVRCEVWKMLCCEVRVELDECHQVVASGQETK